MGEFYRAYCDCGYNSKNVALGRSPSHLEPELALCKNCKEVFSLYTNYTDTVCRYCMNEHHSECPNCNQEAIFYSKENELIIFSQLMRDITQIEESYYTPLADKLPYELYYCPKCGKYDLKFKQIGRWDRDCPIICEIVEE